MPSRTCRVPDVTQSAIQGCTLSKRWKQQTWGERRMKRNVKVNDIERYQIAVKPLYLSFYWFTYQIGTHLLLFFFLSLLFSLLALFLLASLFLCLFIPSYRYQHLCYASCSSQKDCHYWWRCLRKDKLANCLSKGQISRGKCIIYLILDNYMTAYLHNKT